MKTQIVFINIPRKHCIDLILENIKQAEKPEDLSILCICAGPEEYRDFLLNKLLEQFPVEKITFINNPDGWIDHDKIRKNIHEFQIQVDKMLKVYDAYQLAIDNLDPTADFYWFIEDDTMFPLHTYNRYLEIMKEKDCDIVSGQSYYWHTMGQIKRNFWGLKEDRIFEEYDECGDTTVVIDDTYPERDDGVVKLGATGLGNVLAKGGVVRGWQPKDWLHIQNGADIAFFYYAEKKGFKAYGDYGIQLPHITIYPNKSIEIRGPIHESIWPILNRHD